MPDALPLRAPLPRQTSAASDLREGKVGLDLLLAALVIVLGTVAFEHAPALASHPHRGVTTDILYLHSLVRAMITWLTALLVGWLVAPAAKASLATFRSGLTPSQGRVLWWSSLALFSAALGLFVLHFGRRQFGGFDHNILLEVGWRQMLGQRPYVDFPTTSPPLFNLGAYLALLIFGVSWNALLYFTAAFTVATFLLLIALLRAIGVSPAAATFAALTMEAGTMLSSCLWWYNDSTLMLATIFFLAAFLLLRWPTSRLGAVTFSLSLGLLLLAKPNIAGITILGVMVLLLTGTRHRVRVLLLALAGVLLCTLIVWADHISLPAMITTYRGAAKQRGAFSSFGFDEYSLGLKLFIELWFTALCLPVLLVFRPVRAAIARWDWRAAAPWLFAPLGALIAIYGLRGNGELYDVETTVLVAALALLAFALPRRGPLLQRVVVMLFCGMIASNVYFGADRDRVYTVGPHKFFEWTDADHRITAGPLKDMVVSNTFLQVTTQLQRAVLANPQPIFFGPRVDFGYMALGLPSPRHFPAWWHPGTAFDTAQMPAIVQQWQQQRYPTLIFLKDDYTFYPESMMDTLSEKYLRDDRYPNLTVYHRRPGA